MQVSGSGAAMLALCADDESAARVEQAVAKARMLDSWLSMIPQANESFVPKTSILNEFLCL